MNFQDIVDKNSEQFELLKTLDDFRMDVVSAKDICDKLYTYLFTNCFKGSVSGINDYTSIQYNVLRERLIAINAYDLKYTINRIKNIYNNDVINQLLTDIESNYKEVMKIRKITDDTNKMNSYISCVTFLNAIVSTFEKLVLVLNYTNILNKDLSKGIQNPPLKIRSNIREFTEESFTNIVKPIQIMYTSLCIIADIDEKEYPMEIIRVESGTININVNMNFDIGKAISQILSRFHEFIVRNFTKQGVKLNIAESFDTISKQVDIMNALKNAGIDTSDLKPIVKESAAIIFKQANIFLSANPDVKINDKVLNRSKDVKALLDKPMYLNKSQDVNKDNNIEQ